MTRRLLPALALSVLVALPSAAAARPAPLHPAPGDAPASFKGIPGALAKKKSKKKSKKRKADPKAPVVSRVSPKSAKVGDTLVIAGKNFVKGRGKNRVAFYTRSGGAAFARDTSASTKRLKVRVPETLTKLLPANGARSRIVLRVRGKRLGKRSASRISPLIAIKPPQKTGPGAGAGAPACPNLTTPGADSDKDLLTDVVERDLGLNPCLKDSDGDTISDGYEYQSAKDLNASHHLYSDVRPYPKKRPYPNPLYPDADTDYDGDGLTLQDEYRLWMFKGSKRPFDYSDGKQMTAPSPAPGPLALDRHRDMNSDGWLSDDERDADGDGLANWDEQHGRMIPEWWEAMYDGSAPTRPKETKYPITFRKPDMLDADTDGDGKNDGEDDQDFDGLSNTFEVMRPTDNPMTPASEHWLDTYISIGPGRKWHNWDGDPIGVDGDPFEVLDPDPVESGNQARYYSRVQPFNPCKPVFSETCHLHPNFGYYEDNEDWMGYPSVDWTNAGYPLIDPPGTFPESP